MKIILIITCLFFLASCQQQQVIECTLDPKLVKCGREYVPVCGVNGKFKNKTYSNHCMACVSGSKFTVEGACEEYPKCAKFCSPKERAAQACTREYFPHCGWFDHGIQCKGVVCAANGSNRCEACRTQNVLYTTYGKCPTKL